MADSPIDNKVRRAVAAALIEYDAEDGVPIYAVSSITGLNKPTTEEILVLLKHNEEAEQVPPLKSNIWRITDYGRKAYADERFASKLRKCLNCRQLFESSHAGNRLCEKCVVSEYSNIEKPDAL
jgi:hypothetical protein